MNQLSLKCTKRIRTFKFTYAENVNHKAGINQKLLKKKHSAFLKVAMQTLKQDTINFPLSKQK